MQFFTTEMIFTHPPRTFAAHYASPRRRRYGCRTMPRIATAPTDARANARADACIEAQASQASDASAQAPACSTVVEEAPGLIIDEAA